MTAAIDIGFIVVMFLMITAKPLPFTEIRNIQLPYSTLTAISDLDGESATIYIGHGKIRFQMSDTIRRQTLIAMGKKHRLNFSKSEIANFKKVAIVEVPIDSLKLHVNGYDNESYVNAVGIRIDSTNNELADWIKESRKACYDLCAGERLHFYIYADQREEYPQIKRIFDILEQQGEHKWSLITWTKSKQ